MAEKKNSLKLIILYSTDRRLERSLVAIPAASTDNSEETISWDVVHVGLRFFMK